MVQTYQSPVRIYKYPFEIVMAAYEKRFPTCPQIPIFVGSEITFESRSADGAEEVIERKCQLNVDAPYLVKKIAGVDFVYFTQKNVLNRRKRTLNIDATNITFSSRIVINEHCNYYVHPENTDWTCFEQNASLDVKSFFGFESSVEKLAVKQYAANLAKGKEIMAFFIEELISNGTTHIPVFVDDSSPTDSAIDISNKHDDSTSQNGEDVTTAKTDDTNAETLKSSLDQRRRSSKGESRMATSTSTTIHHQSSVDDPDSKLQEEFIRRFIGQLTALEESRLCELKYWLLDHHKGKLPNDAHLLRFLRARDFDFVKAREMVQNSLLWRKQHNVDKILHTFQPSPLLVQFFPGCWHHHDREGRPVFVLRLGQLDIKGLLRSVGLEPLVKFTLSICEQGLVKTAEATKELGVPISTWTMLVDLEGLSMRHLWRPGVQALLRIIEIVQQNYPETMGLVLIARAPRVFPVLWTLISPFIDETTRKKFTINSGEPVISELRKYIDEQYLPEFLGGPCFCLAPEGGHVPKSMYMQVSVDDHQGTSTSSDDNVLQSIYTSAHVYKGAPCEVLVPIASKGCVLTWDFDISKGQCEFQVLRYPVIINPETIKPPHSPVLSPVEMVTAAISGPSTSSAVAFDSALRLGVDLTIEEKPSVFSEGDSMQGSHYCSQTGTYILQWRHVEQPSTLQHHTTFDFSLPGQKCKLMYYYELLDSADFRGSMASLESCRSSFGSLTAASSSSTPVSMKKQNNANSSSQQPPSN